MSCAVVSWPTDSQTVPMASSCPTPIATNTAPSRTSHRYTTGETYVKVAGRLKARLRPIRGLKTDRTASVRDPKGTRSTRIPHDRRSANATVPYTIIVK